MTQITHIHPEIAYDHSRTDKPWRAGMVCIRDGIAMCPGLDYWFATREEAEEVAAEIAEDYYAEAADQGDNVVLGTLRVEVEL